MTEASAHLLDMAKRIVHVYVAHPSARAAMVTGSVAEGESDYFSDIDMTVYYDQLPDEQYLHAAREKNGGGERTWLIGDRSEGGIAEAYQVDGVECQIGHVTIGAWERDIATVLEKLEVTSPLQKALSGTLICVPLHGAPLIQKWKQRAAMYPETLAQAMVKHYLRFFPLWGMDGRMRSRDATLWLHQSLNESAYNILGVLAGLNRLYFSTFQFKRMHKFIDQMQIAPPDLGPRLEHLFAVAPAVAAPELEVLVRETVALVHTHMPQIDTSTVAGRLGWRQQPWTMPEDRSSVGST